MPLCVLIAPRFSLAYPFRITTPNDHEIKDTFLVTVASMLVYAGLVLVIANTKLY